MVSIRASWPAKSSICGDWVKGADLLAGIRANPQKFNPESGRWPFLPTGSERIRRRDGSRCKRRFGGAGPGAGQCGTSSGWISRRTHLRPAPHGGSPPSVHQRPVRHRADDQIDRRHRATSDRFRGHRSLSRRIDHQDPGTGRRARPLSGKARELTGARPPLEGASFGALVADRPFDAGWLLAEPDRRRFPHGPETGGIMRQGGAPARTPSQGAEGPRCGHVWAKTPDREFLRWDRGAPRGRDAVRRDRHRLRRFPTPRRRDDRRKMNVDGP